MTPQAVARPVATTPIVEPVDAREADQQFELGGYARASYTNSARWRDYFSRLEEVSTRFLASAWIGGTHGYQWPLDPLHWWSRTWEYPFVASKLAEVRGRLTGNPPPRLLDIGPAVTFFTLYLLASGFNVTNLDFDPEMPAHFERAFRSLGGALYDGPMPRYLTGDARNTGLGDGSFDVLTCVSVLEHIPGWERVVSEMGRLLRPGGHLVLTFDVKLTEAANGLSAGDVERLLRMLGDAFLPLTRLDREVPVDVVQERNAPMPTPPAPPIPGVTGRPDRIWSRLWPPQRAAVKVGMRLRRLIAPAPPPVEENLCIFGGVWQKR